MNRNGFTLIELLVVVAIIGILAAVGVVAYNGYTKSAKLSAAKSKMQTVIKYIKAENTKCEIGEITVMDGHLNCSNRTVRKIIVATEAALKDQLKHPSDSSKPGICATANACGITYNYQSKGSEGVLMLTEHGPKTTQLGICVLEPCNIVWGYQGKSCCYIESGYEVIFD